MYISIIFLNCFISHYVFVFSCFLFFWGLTKSKIWKLSVAHFYMGKHGYWGTTTVNLLSVVKLTARLSVSLFAVFGLQKVILEARPIHLSGKMGIWWPFSKSDFRFIYLTKSLYKKVPIWNFCQNHFMGPKITIFISAKLPTNGFMNICKIKRVCFSQLIVLFYFIYYFLQTRSEMKMQSVWSFEMDCYWGKFREENFKMCCQTCFWHHFSYLFLFQKMECSLK